MHVYIINGAPGIGKTTLLRTILGHLPADSAVLDGDDVARLQPCDASPRWVNLVQANLVACAANMQQAGVAHLLMGFVFPGEWAYQHLNALLGTAGLSPIWINLVADDACLLARHQARGETRQDIFHESIEFNASIRSLAQAHDLISIDTTLLEVDAVCRLVLAVIARTPLECR
jgi:hypothetical protein